MPSLEQQSHGVRDALEHLLSLRWDEFAAHHDRMLRDSRDVCWPSGTPGDVIGIIYRHMALGPDSAEIDTFQQVILEDCGFAAWPPLANYPHDDTKGALSN